jgi:hypothetical protein
LSYTLLHLAAAVEATRQQKLLQEQPEEETETRSSEDSMRVWRLMEGLVEINFKFIEWYNFVL